MKIPTNKKTTYSILMSVNYTRLLVSMINVVKRVC